MSKLIHAGTSLVPTFLLLDDRDNIKVPQIINQEGEVEPLQPTTFTLNEFDDAGWEALKQSVYAYRAQLQALFCPPVEAPAPDESLPGEAPPPAEVPPSGDIRLFPTAAPDGEPPTG